MEKKIHLAIYNLTQHVVEFEEVYGEAETVDDIALVTDPETGEKVPKVVNTILAADHNEWRLGLECQGRGTLEGAWQVYRGEVPFAWNLVTPKEAPSA